MKKTIILLSLIAISCNLSGNPECSDEDVKSTARKILNERIEDNLINEYIKENLNVSDVIAYARDNGLDQKEYYDTEREKVETEAKEYALNVLNKTKIINIRTNSIEKEIKKCTCSAEIENEDLNKIEIDYTAQYTEDSDDKVYVELKYKIK